MTFPNMLAKSLKASISLDTADLLAASEKIQNAVGKLTLTITVSGRTISAEVATKSLRKCLAVLNEAGADGAVVILQGKLERDTLVEAGVVAQAKAPKATAAA